MGCVDICREDNEMEAVRGCCGGCVGGRQRNITLLYMQRDQERRLYCCEVN